MPFPILGSNSAVAGYEIDNSILSNGANQYLFQTLGTATNRKIWTYSTWIKRGKLGSQESFLSAATSGTTGSHIRFRADNAITWFHQVSGSDTYYLNTNQVFRDVSAWYHLVFVFNSTESTSTDRLKMYVNGSQITSFSSTLYPSLNLEEQINNSVNHEIGRRAAGSDMYFSGYITETQFIDGQAKAPTDFGETNDNGVWIPKEYEGTYGNNGFFLEFKQSGTSANSSGIGADTSGNDNHFSVNAHGANSTALDTPTNNFCTLNPLIGTGVYTAPSYAGGNLTWTSSSNGSFGSSGIATMAPSSGKWYWEARINSSIVNGVGLGARVMEGYFPEFNNDSFFAGSTSSSGGIGYSVNLNTGNPQTNSAEYNTGVAIGSVSTNDILGVAMDLDNGAIYYSINGTFQASGDPTSGSSRTNAQHTFTVDGSYAPAVYGYSSSEFDMNFGGAVSFNVSSANSDANGYGNFEYAVPSGYYSLCTKNLAEYG